MEIVVTWVLFACLVGALAKRRGRGAVGWFVIAVLLSPLVAGIAVLVMKDMSTAAVLAQGELPQPDTHVRCPECRELVRADARKCKHCGAALVPQM